MQYYSKKSRVQVPCTVEIEPANVRDDHSWGDIRIYAPPQLSSKYVWKNFSSFFILFYFIFCFLYICISFGKIYQGLIREPFSEKNSASAGVLKQATVDNFPVGVRWISGLI